MRPGDLGLNGRPRQLAGRERAPGRSGRLPCTLPRSCTEPVWTTEEQGGRREKRARESGGGRGGGRTHRGNRSARVGLRQSEGGKKARSLKCCGSRSRASWYARMASSTEPWACLTCSGGGCAFGRGGRIRLPLLVPTTLKSTPGLPLGCRGCASPGAHVAQVEVRHGGAHVLARRGVELLRGLLQRSLGGQDLPVRIVERRPGQQVQSAAVGLLRVCVCTTVFLVKLLLFGGSGGGGVKVGREESS